MFRPPVCSAGVQVAAVALHQEAPEPPLHVSVDLPELVGGVPGPE